MWQESRGMPGSGSDANKTDLEMDYDDDSFVESDVELDESDTVAPDDDPPQKVSGGKDFREKQL